MVYQLIWSPVARDDLHSIVRCISRDSPPRAQAFALRLITHTEVLQMQPEISRVVPEYRLTDIREIVFRPYRIVYRVNHLNQQVEIARGWHAARGTPNLPAS